LVEWVKRKKAFLYSNASKSSNTVKNDVMSITKLSQVSQRDLATVVGKLVSRIKIVSTGCFRARVYFFLDDSTTDSPVPVQIWDEHASDASQQFLNGLVGSFVVCKYMKPQFSIAFDTVSLHSTRFSQFLSLEALSRENPRSLETLHLSKAPVKMRRKNIICDSVKSLLELNVDGLFEVQLPAFIVGMIGFSKSKLCCSKCNQIAVTENAVLKCPSCCDLPRSGNSPTSCRSAASVFPSPGKSQSQYDYSFDFGKRELMSRDEPPIPGFKWLVQPFKILLCDSKKQNKANSKIAPSTDEPQLQVDVGLDAIQELLFLSDNVFSSNAIARSFSNSVVKRTKTKLTFLLQVKLNFDKNGFGMRQKNLFSLVRVDC